MVPLQQIKWHARNHGIKVLYKNTGYVFVVLTVY